MPRRPPSIAAQKDLGKVQLNSIEIHVYDHCRGVTTQIDTKNRQRQTDVGERAFEKDQIDGLASRQQCGGCPQDSITFHPHCQFYTLQTGACEIGDHTTADQQH